MIKLKHILTEVISDMVWHFTHPNVVSKIIDQNKFELTIGASADASKFAGKRPYFLSLARQKSGGYGKNYTCRIQLDGKKLSQKYKGGAIDYWQTVTPTGPKGDEFEDRLYSFEPAIPNARNYIIKVDVFLDIPTYTDAFGQVHTMRGDDNTEHIVNAMDSCLKQNIPCFLYRDQKKFESELGGEKVTKELADAMRPTPDVDDQPYVTMPRNPNNLDRLVYMAKVVGISEDEITKVFLSNEQAKKNYQIRMSQLEPDVRTKYGTYEDWINTGWEKYKKEEWKLKDMMADRYREARGVIDAEIANTRRDMGSVAREILILIYKQARKDNISPENIIPYIIERAKKKYDEENK